MDIRERLRLRLERQHALGLNGRAAARHRPNMHGHAVVDCGWGRLIFAQTFNDPAEMVSTLCEEQPNRRDIAQRGYHFSRIVERLCENQAPPSAIDHGMTVHVWPVPGGCTTVQTKRVLALKAKT